MRILIVDDSKHKNGWIRWMLENEEIQYDEITYLNGVYRKIINNPVLYDGIILDMKFPVFEGSKAEGRAGEILLERLKYQNINIPVLGNSTFEFCNSSNYSSWKGNTYGFYNPQKLKEFLECLKDGK